MATDAWSQIRARLAALFGRGDSTRTSQEVARLESDREALLASKTSGPSVSGRIQGRLEMMMEQDPTVKAEVESLIAFARATVPQISVTQTANDNKSSTVIQAGGDIAGGINTRPL
jgi:hypothetical protein